MTWLLAVAILMGSLIPVAVGHAHVGGERSHSHDADNAATHREPHHHNGDGSLNTVSNESRVLVGHLHVSFFGVDITLPSQNGEGSEDPESPNRDDRSVVVRLTVDRVTVAPMDLADFVDLLMAQVGVLERIDAAASPLASSGDGPFHRVSLPLRARGERSGVLLI